MIDNRAFLRTIRRILYGKKEQIAQPVRHAV